jgi:hypothetical protein
MVDTVEIMKLRMCDCLLDDPFQNMFQWKIGCILVFGRLETNKQKKHLQEQASETCLGYKCILP